MYGYAIAAYEQGVRHCLRPEFMAQAPYDEFLGNASMVHFTYGSQFDALGEFVEPGDPAAVWSFDKRSFALCYPPSPYPMPPADAPQTMRLFVSMLNEASESIPDWNDHACKD